MQKGRNVDGCCRAWCTAQNKHILRLLRLHTCWSGQETAKTFFKKAAPPTHRTEKLKVPCESPNFSASSEIFVIPRYCARYFHLKKRKMPGFCEKKSFIFGGMRLFFRKSNFRRINLLKLIGIFEEHRAKSLLRNDNFP